MSTRATRTTSALLLVLAASLAANLVGIGFAMPRHYDPSVDAVHPVLSLDVARNAFAPRSKLTLKYPRVHLLVVGVVQRAWLWAHDGFEEGEAKNAALMATLDSDHGGDWLELRERLRPQSDAIAELIVVGRVVSAIAGTLNVLALFLFARALFGAATGLLAAALAAFCYPLVHYAHTLNVDTLVMAFGVLALHAGVRAVQTGSLARLFTSALFMTLAVGTKDYAYGWFLLTAPLLVWLFARPGELAPATPPRRLPVLGVLVVGALAIVAYLVAQGLPFDREGFVEHTRFLFSPGVDSFRQVDPHTLSGQWSLFVRVLRETTIAAGWPVVIAALIGIVLMFRAAPKKALLVVVPAISFDLTFLAPIGFTFVRFLVPILYALFVAAAFCCVALIERRGSRLAGAALALVLVGHAVWRTARLDAMLRNDPIDAATEWLATNVPPGARVLAWFDLPLQTIEPPPQAKSYLFKDLTDSPPADFGVPDFFLMSRYDTTATAADPHPEPVIPVKEFRRFGARLVLDRSFDPMFEHPIRAQAAFQPHVFVYRRAQ